MTQQHKVRPEMEGLLVPINSLRPHPSNPHKGDVPAIMLSLEHFGQVRPILVQSSTDLIVAGHHTLYAAQKLGWKEIAAVKIDLTEEEARRYLISDNRLARLGTEDATELHSLLQLEMDVGDLGPTGYTIDDVEDLAGQLELGTRTEDGGLEPADFVANPKKREELAQGEPLREIVLLLPASRCVELGIALDRMKKALGTTSVSDTIERIVLTAVKAMGASDAERAPTAATDPNISVQTPVADGPGELSQIEGVVQPMAEPDESLEEYRQRMQEPEPPQSPTGPPLDSGDDASLWPDTHAEAISDPDSA